MFSCCWSSILLFIFGCLGLLKVYIKVTTGIFKGKETLNGKTVIVTGASSGIGLESAKEFARRGGRVVMLCRDMVKGKKVRKAISLETGNDNLILKKIDFTSLSSVRNCAKEILEECSRIDILLNNAGSAGMPSKITDDGMEILMQSNHFGPFLFTNILLGRIKESAPSRIVNVASLAHKIANLDLDHLDMSNTSNGTIVYANSKLCNILFTNELANKLRRSGVTVNSLHPGVVLTEIVRNAPSYFQMIWNALVWLFCKSAWEGAQTQIFLCLSRSLSHTTGEYFSDCKSVSTSSAARDQKQAARLWELSERAVKLQDSEKHF